MEKKPKHPASEGPRPMSPFKKGVLVLLALVFIGSVGARAVLGAQQEEVPATTARPAVGPDGFLPQTGPHAPQPAPAEDPAPLEGWLPIFTEGSFFALLGFALGYASRKIVKVLLIFIAIFFAGIQALVYADVMTVDWGHAIELVNRLVLNLREDQPFSEILKHKIPTVGALFAGYLLGFRRG